MRFARSGGTRSVSPIELCPRIFWTIRAGTPARCSHVATGDGSALSDGDAGVRDSGLRTGVLLELKDGRTRHSFGYFRSLVSPLGEMTLFTAPVSTPDKQHVEALGAWSTSDTARVRARLEGWVNRASNAEERIGRQAQMFYRLFRAGDPTQLDRLEELSDANPNSAEATHWWRLATQNHHELRS
jgi:hypothetical protein